MPKFRRIKKFGKTFLDVPAWMGWSRLKSSSQAIGSTAKRLFIPQKPQIKEEFHEAINRLNLSEEDILDRQKSFLKLSIIFVIMGFMILIYAVYLAWSSYIRSAFIALGLTLLVFAIAFRYHFWYFQVKHRRLGCTLREWYHGTIENSQTIQPTSTTNKAPKDGQ